jgi:hypothetical protein
VEPAQIEFWPQRLFRPRAQFADLEFADLVGERLSRPGDVAVDLGLDIGGR